MILVYNNGIKAKGDKMTKVRQEAIKKLNKLSTHKKMCLMVELNVWGKEFTLVQGYEACYKYFEGAK